MGFGGGTQRTEQTVKLPKSLEVGAREVLAAGMRAAALPYTPNRGVTVAAFTPQQEAAMQGANLQASAFGLPSVNSYGISPNVEMTNGVAGYSTGTIYDDMLDASTTQSDRDARQGLLDEYLAAAARISGGGQQTAANPLLQILRLSRDAGRGGDSWFESSTSFQGPNQNGRAGYGAGGYTGLLDMVDGGGPGVSGGAFSGGGRVSDAANSATGGGK